MAGFTRPQLRNAAIIYQVGRKMGASPRDIQIALITAMTESNLINVNYGDRDSLGLFQQRPSQGWGSPQQVTNPEYAARKFFQALFGLGKRRNSMGMGAAAQAVQRSAFPGRYNDHIPLVRAMWDRVQNAAGGAPLPSAASTVVPGAVHPMVASMNALGAVSGPLDDGFEPVQPDTHPSLGAASFPELGVAGSYEPNDPSNMFPASVMTPEGFSMTFQTVGAMTPGGKGVSGWRQAVIELAKRQVGTPYVWGGDSPGGFDCSGILQWAFNRAGPKGFNMPRISYQQANSGRRTKIKNLMPGDLVAWNNSSRNPGADHIALYLGGGRILEAPRTGLNVRIRKLSKGEGAYGVHLPF